jgi:aspartyl protease family protein
VADDPGDFNDTLNQALTIGSDGPVVRFRVSDLLAAGMMICRYQQQVRNMLRAVLVLVALVAVVSITAPKYFGQLLGKPGQPSTMVATESQTVRQQTQAGYRTVTLNSDRRGHFQVEARIDGRSIGLVVDTGASKIVLRETSAARLGIFPRASEYTGRAQTANGVAKFAPVRLASVEVNGIVVRDVEAAVMADDALHENLLGMTFLSRVKWSHDRGKLILEQ